MTGGSGNSSSASSSSSTSDNSAIYYNGLFEVPNPDSKLRVSMTAQVFIILNEAKHALCIPLSAVGDKHKDGSYTVRILKNNIPETRIIRLGINNNVRAQVTEGLQKGDKIIIGDSASKEKPDPGSKD
jgi:macrolide-specific efflux system membrane fusion protein